MPFRRTIQWYRKQQFVDRVKVLLASGNGGDGASVMTHEHGNEFGGPGGGNGGNGGNVMLRCSRRISDLSSVRQMGSHLVASPGNCGYARESHGKRGVDLWLELPLGTEVVDVDTNETLFDLEDEGMEVLLLEGGQGGKGNASFANKWNHSPLESTRGLPGNSMLALLELKTIADCGLVGYPNAGKSSVLSAISSSKPEVAPYAFTTLRPYIGTLHDLYGNTCRVADVPGLIEGAYENRGLGHQFLRHLERTQTLALVVDMYDSYRPLDASPQEPWEVVETLRNELRYYSSSLNDRVVMIFANKTDLITDSRGSQIEAKLEELRTRTKLPVFPVSAALGCALGHNHPQTGLAPALQFLCAEVFKRNSMRRNIQQKRLIGERNALERAYRAKHNGVFFGQRPKPVTADSYQSLEPSQPASLVDQQLDSFVGNSSTTGEIDGYQHSQGRGSLHQYRDLTMKGRYWSLTRDEDERLRNEQWN